jgi:crotonobetainyl-CoA:carnitine CoA-transferase CaiB-like acyl-CoA transferase
MTSNPDDTGPLDGIRVLDVGTLTPGKYCTYLLADLGADVIRVERPVGTARPVDDEDLILNQGKRSVTLNLRTEAGRALFLQLAAEVDVVLEGNRPGTADRNGFGYQAVKQDNERIIYCALSGYGATGPLSQTAGYDLIFLSLSGMLQALTGNSAAPALPDAYLADGISGLSAAYAIMVSLFTRERTGRGAFIDLAMLDSTFALLAASHGVRKNEHKAEHKAEDPSPLYDVYAAAEDTHLVLGAIRPASRAALFDHLGRPDLAENTAEVIEMRTFLQEAFHAKTADVWVAELTLLDVEAAPVNQPEEAFDHPQLRQRGMIGTTSHPDTGEFEFIRPAFNPLSADEREQPSSAAPRIGQHTEEVLKSLGVTESRLTALRNEGVI